MGIFRAAMTSVVSRCVDNLNSSTDFRALFDKLDHFKNNSVCKRSANCSTFGKLFVLQKGSEGGFPAGSSPTCDFRLLNGCRAWKF